MTVFLTRSELLERNESLRLENELFRQILDNISEGVQISTDEEVMIYYNRACERIEQVDSKNCLGKKIKSIYSQTSLTNQSTLHRVVSGTQAPAIGVYNQYMTNGVVTNVISSTYPFHLSPTCAGVYSILRDAGLLRQYINEVTQLKRNRNATDETEEPGWTFDKILHTSLQMQDCIHIARRLAPTSANILLYGETGTGKELFAQSIHNASLHAHGPFVAINCAAIPETLLESLLFGTEKGAFTGAAEQVGLLEQADSGTFFLDEINSMSGVLQAKLLRVIETRTCRRVGGKKDRRINCRFLSATNRDPLVDIENRNLRQDLYYRLCDATVHIPPLRARKKDIPLLCRHFIKISDRLPFSHVRGFDDEVMNLFIAYDWPGNVRELKHDVEYCVSMAPDGQEMVTVDTLHPSIARKYTRDAAPPLPAPLPDNLESGTLQEQLAAVERDILVKTLQGCAGNISQAARKLGLHRQALQYRMRKFEL